MGKRKRNQQAKSADGQSAVPPQSKKLKVSDSTTKDATSEVKHSKDKSLIDTPHPEQQTVNESTKPADPAIPVPSGLSKAAAKRERHRKKLREAKKKTVSGDGAEQQEAPKQSEQQAVSEKQVTVAKPGQSQPKAVDRKSKKVHRKDRKTKDISKKDAPKKPLDVAASLPSKTSPSSKKRVAEIAQGDTKDSKASQPATKKLKKSKEASKKPSSARQRRRQKIRMAKEAAASVGLGHTMPVPEVRDANNPDTMSVSSTKEEPKVVASLFDEATKTQLLPRPVKQWIEDDELDHDALATTNDVTVQATTKDHSPPASRSSSPTPAHSPSPSHIAPASKRDEASESFATVGVSSVNQTPATTSTPITRPGINSIASFSLSSRRHPASVLSKHRTISGLSGMRMDTGMIGSSPKPVSASKANSIPSSSGPGDAKAAFQRFQKFAHGGNSSESDEDSDESESESDDDVQENGAQGAVPSPKHNAPSTPSVLATQVKSTTSVLDDLEREIDRSRNEIHDGITETSATLPGPGQVDSTAEGDASSSADSSESDSEEAAPQETHDDDEAAAAAQLVSDLNATAPDDGGDLLVQPPSDASNMLGEKDLPSFSAFNAKHNITPADSGVERAANFLGRELGGGPFGSGHIDEKDSSINHLPIDYVASQDADDLYKSIDDISREVFKSIHEIPDCKPLSKPLDVESEHFVTDHISGHGLGRKSAELSKTPEKATTLSTIPRRPSPVIWAVHGLEMSNSVDQNVADAQAGTEDDEDDEVDDVEYKPLHSTHKTESDQHNSRPTSSSISSSPISAEDESQVTPAETKQNVTSLSNQSPEHLSNDQNFATDAKKRKLTGVTSKHFSPTKSQPKTRRTNSMMMAEESVAGPDSGDDVEQPKTSQDFTEITESQRPKKKKGTGKTSAFFTPASSPSKSTNNKKTTPRPPKGTSTCPVPSTHSAHFGLLQEKLWDQPFWLIIAVQFLNKTAGRAAAPIFWSLKELYPTPEDLSQAKQEDLVEMIGTLGLQNQRAKKLISIAKTWLEDPPAKGQRYRTLHYPAKGDGKDIKKDEIVEEDDDDCAGALEIGHIPGCGPYAYDSWRIFCRDVQRGLAKDYNGRRAKGVGFEPEWQRVVPLDKELRACLRWMWLREGYVWNHETGDKRDATLDEMEAAMKGEMEIADEQERKFAMEAADVTKEKVEDMLKHQDAESAEKVASQGTAPEPAKRSRPRKMTIAQRELDVEPEDETAVTSVRRSRRKIFE